MKYLLVQKKIYISFGKKNQLSLAVDCFMKNWI